MIRRLKDVVFSAPIGKAFTQLKNGLFEFLGHEDLVR